ncbi:MAG: hypothetical protein PHP52_02080 [Bacteroidales bacterium]|nr:hypothetical protein [Bacteroidales bacterium]MDD4215849.1 hypothetical protein [Bacteroidales bacterium]MDY0140698.1 hypothetical protein [Bacteroidales bacterium]
MIFNETSKTEIHIFAAYSDNIINWYPANNGEPLFTATDFKNTTWAGKDITGEYLQTPYSSELVHYNNKWHLFLYGFNDAGKRQIGLAVSDSTILGPYTIYKDPIISNGSWLSWDENACLSARVTKYKDRFIMFYNALNRKGNEKLGLATSSDLIQWQKYKKNPILAQNTGWRSCKKVAEPNYIEVRNDSIFIIVLGAKKFKSGLWHQYVTKRLYMDKSGNVDDNQYGFYLSVDGGKSFIAHKNNPIFINDYSNIYENGHLGGGFKYIITDTSEFIIYQAKTTYNSLSYNIMVRERKKRCY